MTRLLLLMVWGLLSYWFCCCGVFNIFLCVFLWHFTILFQAPVSWPLCQIEIHFCSVSDEKYTISARVGCHTLKTRAKERECVSWRFLFKGCFKDTEKRSVSHVSLFWAHEYLSFICLTTPVKGKEWKKCCQVVLCRFKVNRTIYCFSCGMIWYKIFNCCCLVYELE